MLGKQPMENNIQHLSSSGSFSTERIKSTAYKYEPLAAPFIEFAKAYIRYTYSLNPIRNLARHIESLRIVEMALYNIKGKADILQLDY